MLSQTPIQGLNKDFFLHSFGTTVNNHTSKPQIPSPFTKAATLFCKITRCWEQEEPEGKIKKQLFQKDL